MSLWRYWVWQCRSQDAVVPHCLGNTVHSISQVHDLSPFSYLDYSSSDFLCPICTVSCLVHSMHRWSMEKMSEGGKGRWMSKETRIHLAMVEEGQQQQVVVQLWGVVVIGGGVSSTSKMRKGWRWLAAPRCLSEHSPSLGRVRQILHQRGWWRDAYESTRWLSSASSHRLFQELEVGWRGEIDKSLCSA